MPDTAYSTVYCVGTILCTIRYCTVRFHAKIIPWGHDSQDFVELGFFESDGEVGDEYDEDEDEAALMGY